ncbi:hypothetical protein N7471_012832 [Penicillium samsonianum]|uniref:uncharacterized protein n=1 Tax=Penicillium samsonianum TaxID=1882272 RepID=UPI002547685C|nr:uncharacterized protein N7471_012832 [Penicillium samsonianum]KAJ6125515.1 hypothetical protein N7471_012832 [Penicillium samsonianum]
MASSAYQVVAKSRPTTSSDRNTHRTLSASSAKVIQAAWSGSGNAGWSSVNKDAAIDSYYIPTICTSNGTCTAGDSALFGNWFKYANAKDPSFPLQNMTDSVFFGMMHASMRQYAGMVGINNPDLSKMITYMDLPTR